VKRCVQVSATVADYGKTVIGVRGLDESGKNDTTGRNAVKDQCVDVIGAKNHGEIRAGEGTDSVLGYNDFIALRCDGSRDRPERLPEEPLMLLGGFNGAEESISGADLGEPRSKTYLDVDDGHASSTSMIENTCGSNQKGVFALPGVDGNDAGLTIHAQDGRVSRINRECVSHI